MTCRLLLVWLSKQLKNHLWMKLNFKPFKDDLEKKFAIDLFRFSIVNSECFSDLISEKLKSELDR